MNENLSIPNIKQEIYINVDPQRVYHAITTSQEWNTWFTQETAIDFKVGGMVDLRWRDWGINHVTSKDGGPIVEIEPNRVFSFLWNRGSQPTTVRFTLEALGTGTRLTLTDSGELKTQSDLDLCVDCASGWGEALALLKFYLEYGVVYGNVPK